MRKGRVVGVVLVLALLLVGVLPETVSGSPPEPALTELGENGFIKAGALIWRDSAKITVDVNGLLKQEACCGEDVWVHFWLWCEAPGSDYPWEILGLDYPGFCWKGGGCIRPVQNERVDPDNPIRSFEARWEPLPSDYTVTWGVSAGCFCSEEYDHWRECNDEVDVEREVRGLSLRYSPTRHEEKPAPSYIEVQVVELTPGGYIPRNGVTVRVGWTDGEGVYHSIPVIPYQFTTVNEEGVGGYASFRIMEKEWRNEAPYTVKIQLLAQDGSLYEETKVVRVQPGLTSRVRFYLWLVI